MQRLCVHMCWNACWNCRKDLEQQQGLLAGEVTGTRSAKQLWSRLYTCSMPRKRRLWQAERERSLIKGGASNNRRPSWQTFVSKYWEGTQTRTQTHIKQRYWAKGNFSNPLTDEENLPVKAFLLNRILRRREVACLKCLVRRWRLNLFFCLLPEYWYPILHTRSGFGTQWKNPLRAQIQKPPKLFID